MEGKYDVPSAAGAVFGLLVVAALIAGAVYHFFFSDRSDEARSTGLLVDLLHRLAAADQLARAALQHLDLVATYVA